MTLLHTPSTTLQFTNWANICFGPSTLLLVCVTSLLIPRCVLLTCIFNSSYIYRKLTSDVKSSANCFEVVSQNLSGFSSMFLKIRVDFMECFLRPSSSIRASLDCFSEFLTFNSSSSSSFTLIASFLVISSFSNCCFYSIFLMSTLLLMTMPRAFCVDSSTWVTYSISSS